MVVLERHDDGSQIEFWGRAAGSATNGAWSEVTLARRNPDGTTEMMKYVIVDREPGLRSGCIQNGDSA